MTLVKSLHNMSITELQCRLAVPDPVLTWIDRDSALHFPKLKFSLGREHFFLIYLHSMEVSWYKKIIIIIRYDEKSHPVCLYGSMSIKYVSESAKFS